MGNEVLHMDELLAPGLAASHGIPVHDSTTSAISVGPTFLKGSSVHWSSFAFPRPQPFFLFANLTFDWRNTAVLQTSRFFGDSARICRLQLGTQLISTDAATHAVVASLSASQRLVRAAKFPFALLRDPHEVSRCSPWPRPDRRVDSGQVGLFHTETIHLTAQNVDLLARSQVPCAVGRRLLSIVSMPYREADARVM